MPGSMKPACTNENVSHLSMNPRSGHSGHGFLDVIPHLYGTSHMPNRRGVRVPARVLICMCLHYGTHMAHYQLEFKSGATDVGTFVNVSYIQPIQAHYQELQSVVDDTILANSGGRMITACLSSGRLSW